MSGKRQLTAIIEREGDGYVALCAELDVASQGDTVEEARANLVEAPTLFFESADPSEVRRRLKSDVFITRGADGLDRGGPGRYNPAPVRSLIHGRSEGMATARSRKAAAPVPASSLSPKDVRKVLELVKGAKSIEMKLTVPMTKHQTTALGLGLDPVESQPRHVYFFDTPEFALNRAGLIVRARRIQGGRADTVVKLRPVDPAMIDAELKRSDSFKVEVDVMPDGYFACSASYKGTATGQEVLDVVAGTKPLRSLFSKEQRAFYDAHAPADIGMNSLIALGPILLLRAKHAPEDFPRGITVELWLWPDGKHVLEISTKALPSEAFQVGMEFKAYLADNGVDLGAVQETKTRAAMEYFKEKAKVVRRARRPKAGKAAKAADAAP